MYIQKEVIKTGAIEGCDKISQGLKSELRWLEHIQEAIDNGHKVILKVSFENQELNTVDAINTIEGRIPLFDDCLNREHFMINENGSDNAIDGIKDDGFSVIHYTQYMRRENRIEASLYLFFRSASGVGVDNLLEKTLQQKWSKTIKIGDISFLRDGSKGISGQKSITHKGRSINVADGISVIKNTNEYVQALLNSARSKH